MSLWSSEPKVTGSNHVGRVLSLFVEKTCEKQEAYLGSPKYANVTGLSRQVLPLFPRRPILGVWEDFGRSSFGVRLEKYNGFLAKASGLSKKSLAFFAAAFGLCGVLLAAIGPFSGLAQVGLTRAGFLVSQKNDENGTIANIGKYLSIHAIRGTITIRREFPVPTTLIGRKKTLIAAIILRRKQFINKDL